MGAVAETSRSAPLASEPTPRLASTVLSREGQENNSDAGNSKKKSFCLKYIFKKSVLPQVLVLPVVVVAVGLLACCRGSCCQEDSF